VVQMATLEPGERLAELLQRLEAIEQRLGGAATPVRPAGAPASGPPARPASGGPKMASPAAAPVGVLAAGGGQRPVSLSAPGTGSAPLASAGAARASAPAIVAAPAPAVVASAPAVVVAPAPAVIVASPPAVVAVSAPATVAAVAAGPATAMLDAPEAPADRTATASWDAVVTAVNAKKRMLGAFLQACQFSGVTDTHVILAMDDLHRAVVDEKENRATGPRGPLPRRTSSR